MAITARPLAASELERKAFFALLITLCSVFIFPVIGTIVGTILAVRVRRSNRLPDGHVSKKAHTVATATLVGVLVYVAGLFVVVVFRLWDIFVFFPAPTL